MPRSINSNIGSRVLSIEDIGDNFSASTNALPNGNFGLAIGTSPDTTTYARDAAGNGAAYNMRPGGSRSWNYWQRGGGFDSPWQWGVAQQNQGVITPGAANFRLSTNGNAFQVSVSRGFTWQQFPIAGLPSALGWRMHTITWDPAASTHGRIVTYNNGGNSQTGDLTSAANVPTDTEFTIGGVANFSQSLREPLASANGAFELAKFAVFDKVLTAQEIADLYLAMIS